MKKYLLWATVLTFLTSTTVLADVTQSYQECRQAEGLLGWFLVTYTVYPQPAPTGHRIPTAVEDMKQACTTADYEQSRQAGAMWGENWPALQSQPGEKCQGPGRMPDIFISYERRDQPLAKELAEYLLSLGFPVWWDNELLGSDDF